MDTSKSSTDINEKLAIAVAKTVSFDDINATNNSNINITNSSSTHQKKKKNAKVKLKSVENIDQLSTTNKSTNPSKSTSLASVASSTFKFSYSYVVLIASFMSYMLASLLSSCFGVFFESMSTDLRLSRSRVAFVGSLLTALQDLAGPISSALTNHFGCRKTTIFGGFICALGIIGSAYTSEFWLLGLLMGCVSGFGASLVLVSSVVVVTYYFEDKPSFAAGFTISGASFGQSIFTMIIIKLNEEYGRSGCFLILGGILLNIIVCGSLFRPLKWELEDEEDDEEDDDEDEEETDEDDDDEEDDDEETEESEDDENESKIKQTLTKESNLNELESAKQTIDPLAPIASQEKLIDSLNANECLNLYFDNQTENIYIVDNKNENQVFYLENEALSLALNENELSTGAAQQHSSQYLRSRKDFSSDPCLNQKEENDELEMPSIGVSLISLNSNFLRENQFKQVEQFQKNFYFDKHHSLQLIPTEEAMQNAKEEVLLRAKSDLILKNYSAYSLTSKKEVLDIIDDQQDLNNAEFVLLDAEEINDNLMLSASQTAIYLPFNNTNAEEENSKNLDNHPDELDAQLNDPVCSNKLESNEEIKSTSNHTDNLASNNSNSNANSRMMSQQNSTNALSSITDSKLEHHHQSPNNNITKTNLATNNIKDNLINSINKPERPLSTFSNFLNLFSNLFTVNRNKPLNISNQINLAPIVAVTTTTTTTPTPAINETNLLKPTNGTLVTNHDSAKINLNTTNLNQTNKNLIRLETLILNQSANQMVNNKQGPRFIIARCNCRKRYLQNLQRRSNKQRRAKIRSYSVNINSNETNLDTEMKSQPSLLETKPQVPPQPQFNKFRHYPNCPISNLKRVKHLHLVNQLNLANQSGTNNHHHNHANHHHHTHQAMRQRNNMYYVPSLFQNSYRFPLHFKNVYYYKSLINLNMRLKNLKSHSNHPATLAGVFDPTSFHPLNSQHIHHLPHQQHQQQQQNSVSLSCPNLNPKQFLIMNKNVISIRKLNEQYGGQIIPIKAIKRPMQILTTNELKDLIPHHNDTFHANHRPVNLNFKSNLAETSKVLNAGSILLTTSQTIKNAKKPAFQEKPIVIKFRPNQTNRNQPKLSGDKLKINESIISLNDYHDKIIDEDVSKEKLLNKKSDDEEEEDEDEDEDDEEDEDDDEDDDSEDDEELCDNWFTHTKAGNYIYKKTWKPMIKSIKFIYYSIRENLKLFRFFRFCVFAFCNFILSFFYEAPFVFINSYMMNNKLSESQAGSVTVAVGIVCIFSSIAYGYIGDSKRINPIILYSFSLVLCGLSCVAVPFFITNYWITMTLMVLMGALISVSDVLVPIICVNIVGYDDFVNAYGLMFFCQGLASLSGPPLLAIIVDYSRDYALSYFIIGIGIILSGLILSIVLCYNQYTKQNKDVEEAANNNNNTTNKKANNTVVEKV